MSKDKKPTENKCPGCGSDKVLLTEDLYAEPRCAGCGKTLKKDK
jgi:DNA-directed RNA polymerase subunit RPC12/RpoP